MKHPIPADALKDYVAIIGRVGSGKTYAAKGMVESVLRALGRVIIIDPTGVWWGVRASADGTQPGFPVVVFGGQHADVPLADGAGTVLAQLLAAKSIAAIVDVSEFTIGARTRFLTAFLDELYRANRTPLTLVVDEADIVAPQRPMPDQTLMFSRMEQICRRGRVRGFRPWLITQRPAELHKSVLSQANTLIAMQLTAPQDRDAVGAWIEGQADRDEGKKVLADLPKLRRGEGWAWSPSHNLLSRVKFPAITTFDSSRTPEEGEALARVELAPVDLAGITESLKTAEADAAANDPKTLRARIAELERDRTGADGTLEALMAEYTRGRAEGFATGHAEGFDDAMSAVRACAAKVRVSMNDMDNAWQALIDATEEAKKTSTPFERMQRAVVDSAFGTDTPATPTLAVREVRIQQGRGKGEAMSTAERAILAALAQCHGKRSTRARISLLSGYSVTSSTFANAISALKAAGRAEGRADEIQITADGVKALGQYEALPTGQALIAYWANRVDAAERALFLEIAKRYPRAVTKEALSEATGYSATSSTFANALSKLRTLELISGRGEFTASRDFFE